MSMDTLIEIWVDDTEVSLDRNYQLITEGQSSDVVLRFHFDESWASRTTKIISMLNRNRIYTQPMHDDVVRVPRHMVTEGCLKFIVRGFLGTSEDIDIVFRDGHFIVTDEPKPQDVTSFSYTDRAGSFSVSDENRTDSTADARTKPNTHIVLSDEVLYKETMDVKPVEEDDLGYMEVSLLGDEAIYIGRKRI